MVASFTITSVPKTYVGAHSLSAVISEMKAYGYHHVLITGSSSFLESEQWENFQNKLHANGLSVSMHSVKNEPTPGDIDTIVKENTGMQPGSVVSIGGGSVIDAGKAVSAMLPLNEPVKDYLEGVGSKKHPGVKIPFIAIPTTAATGSEATKNAVISEVGKNGFKKSLRHDHFVPDLAVIDPTLQTSCPSGVTASGGMDAITQLIESYVSTKANVFTDSLCLEALKLAIDALPVVMKEPENLNAREKMAYAAYISGITLTNAGLGTVHGFASTIGGRFQIPHGTVCGTLLPEVTKFTIEHLKEENSNPLAIDKYAIIGRIFSGNESLNRESACNELIDALLAWKHQFKIPGLSDFGITEEDFDMITKNTGQKNNPTTLNTMTLNKILKFSL